MDTVPRELREIRYAAAGMSVANIARMRNALTGLAMACALGCSSGDDDDGSTSSTLDCAWIQSQNCWKQALDEVAACVPQPTENGTVTTGTLDAERLTCSYESGTVVRFDEPLVPTALDTIALGVEHANAECVRFERSVGDLSLRVPSGQLTVHGEIRGESIGMTITCADGSAHSTPAYLETLHACEPDPSDWPGLVVEQMGPAHTGLDLSGGNGGQVKLFSCNY